MSDETNETRSTQETARIRDWLSTEDPVSIATHIRVDADAAFSAALLHILRPRASIAFVRADSVIVAPDCIAVDLSNGPRSVKGLRVGSAFGAVVDALRDIDRPVHDALTAWASQLNETDSGMPCRDRLKLSQLVECWRSSGMEDREILARSEELLRGRIASSRMRDGHRRNAEKAVIDGSVCVIGPGVHVRSCDLFKRGAQAVIRESKIGQCITISRQAQAAGMSLCELRGLLPDSWFIHDGGFIACYGGVKSPKDPRGSGVGLQELEDLVRIWITSHQKQ